MPIAALSSKDSQSSSTSEDLVSASENLVVVLKDIGTRGDVGLTYKGDYDNNVQYHRGDAVNYNGVVYLLNNTPVVGTAPTDGAVPPVVNGNWDMLLDQPSNMIEIGSHGNMPKGTLQEVLEYLEDKQFSGTVDPTTTHAGETHAGVPSVDEGDFWYDETNDRMNVYRNGEWEVMTLNDALAYDSVDDPAIDDEIEMDGGSW